MNTRYRSLLFLGVVVVASVVTCFVTGKIVRCTCDVVVEDTHTRLHRELDITAEQDPAIEVLERKFAARRAAITARIEAVNKELAGAMRESRGPSPRVSEAVKQNHEVQAELQQAVLDHVFEMRSVLRPDQYEKLIKLTAEALDGGAH